MDLKIAISIPGLGLISACTILAEIGNTPLQNLPRGYGFYIDILRIRERNQLRC
jgi:hypothetical protein